MGGDGANEELMGNREGLYIGLRGYTGLYSVPLNGIIQCLVHWVGVASAIIQRFGLYVYINYRTTVPCY